MEMIAAYQPCGVLLDSKENAFLAPDGYNLVLHTSSFGFVREEHIPSCSACQEMYLVHMPHRLKKSTVPAASWS